MKNFCSICKCLPVVVLAFLVATMQSCSEDDSIYKDYEENYPDFVGGSIYDQLKEAGNFTTYLRLIDDLGYKEVLSLTGSKTVFAANDEAFEAFYQDNIYGVSCYEELSKSQKRMLLNSSMINMSYLTGMLANATLSSENIALRRAGSTTYLDTIPFVTDEVQLSSPFWTNYKDKGLYLLDDYTDPFIIHFTPQHALSNNITSEDMSIILGDDYDSEAVYINGTKVIDPNIYCKNGYIHIVEDVLTPNRNISQIIAQNGQTALFNSLMNRYSIPEYNASLTAEVHKLYDGSNPDYPLITDSVFVKRYFTKSNPWDAEGHDMTTYGVLHFDPSNNNYGGSMSDMGVMFVPTDEALDNYINGSKGKYLKDSYGSWENVPNDLVALFVKNHQKKSFMSSLPSMWPTMNDEESFAMNVKREDVVKSYIASNGIVFVTNTVYPPIDYQSVYGPVLTNDNTKIMKWALTDNNLKFYLYLRSMENMYNLLVPTDEALQNYQDPIAYAKGGASREIWSFKYDETKNTPVSADVYSVNPDGTRGAFLRTIEGSKDAAILRNRLNDICDSHIIVGDMAKDGTMSGYLDDGTKQYLQAKSNAIVEVAGANASVSVRGGGDIEQGNKPATLVTSDSGGASVYDSDNGRTYFINSVVQLPTQSVYQTLDAHNEFSSFLELLNGNAQVFALFPEDSEITAVFGLKIVGTTSGLGPVVNSFNNYHYTVLIPTNEAVAKAFAENPKLHTWEEIEAEPNIDIQREWAVELIRFLKYHFVDNSVFVGNSYLDSGSYKYETAARNDNGRFQKLTIDSDGADFTITDAQGNVANVVKTPGLYNLQSRDFIVDSSDFSRAKNIVSSSYAVIHLIDRALMPE